jgi:hypothetical protein
VKYDFRIDAVRWNVAVGEGSIVNVHQCFTAQQSIDKGAGEIEIDQINGM